MLRTALFTSAATLVSVVAAVGPVVDLGYTKYQGVDNGNGVSHWIGMRYAAPPVGELRFARPQDPISHTTVQPANKHGRICLGTGASPTEQTFMSESEDCLFIDVYAPSNATEDSNLPVFFFIQGGGFVSNANGNYNGTGLVQAGDYDMIVVTSNYRVGPYGFLTDMDKIEPNNGLYDQVKGLEWVQQHIKHFGGDPKHVVIGGDSAGAGSVSYHLTREGGKNQGLFVGAAAESISGSTIFTVDEAQFLHDSFAKRAHCDVQDSLTCLRNASIETLQAANTNVQPLPGNSGVPLFGWNPVIDGQFIQYVTYEAFERGGIVRVPIIAGSDTDDGSVFTPQDITTFTDVNNFIKDQFPYLTQSDLNTIDHLYPNPDADQCPNKGCMWHLASLLYGHQRYMCTGLMISGVYGDAMIPSYAYLWNVEDPTDSANGLGVTHTSEVHAIWGPEYTNGGAPKSYYPGQKNANAVTDIQGYWTSFIRTLDPNKYRAGGSASWGMYANGIKERMEFGTGGTTVMKQTDQLLNNACAFYKSIAVRIRQ